MISRLRRKVLQHAQAQGFVYFDFFLDICHGNRRHARCLARGMVREKLLKRIGYGVFILSCDATSHYRRKSSTPGKKTDSQEAVQ